MRISRMIRGAASFDYDAGPTILALRKTFSRGFDAGVSASAEDNAYFLQELDRAVDDLVAFLKKTRRFADVNPGYSPARLTMARNYNATIADSVARLTGLLGLVMSSGRGRETSTSVPAQE